MPDKKSYPLKPGWRIVKFGDVVTQVKDRVNDPMTSGHTHYVRGEDFVPAQIRLGGRSKLGDGQHGPAFHMQFKSGDVLYVSRNPRLRKAAAPNFDGICANTTYVCRSDRALLLQELLPFIMQTEEFSEYTKRHQRGSTNFYVNWSDIAPYEFMLPPMDEQHRLVKLLTSIEDSLASAEELAASAERLRHSLMIDHFEAMHPEYRKVSEIGKWHSGGTPSRGNTAYWGGPIPWISPKDMKRSELDAAEETLTQKGVEAGSKLMPKDTIFIVVRGMILAHTFPVARTLVPAAFNQDMKALVVDDAFRPKYIQYWFEYAAQRYLRLVSESSHGTKRLESDKLFSLTVPKLSTKEQDMLIELVDEARSTVGNADSRRTDALVIKRQFLSLNLGSSGSSNDSI